MFEITGDDISLLNDTDLRTLIGLLCESEMQGRGLPASCVTWGGKQDAGDGGIDVWVQLPAGTTIDGFVPRPVTGFQVKATTMPPEKISREMRPRGEIRLVIRDLADQSGAYIIVSSSDSCTAPALNYRRDAMKVAANEISNNNSLCLDFYDRGRVATWVRDHKGLIPWVRKSIGKAIPGWQSYDAWAYDPDGKSGEYLVDDTLRLQTGQIEHGDGLPGLQGLQLVRTLLRKPGKVARLVGHSGVGKTRFIQALFDERIGEQHLDPSLAIYTDTADQPAPPPTTLATNLIASRTRAILVIDNCPSDLHRRLAEHCRSAESTVSVITVEYDIREDQPEGTEVFSLEPSSTDLIEKLLRHRFPNLSVVDAGTVAEFSGGNARIAIALAGMVGKDESIAGLADEELFRRLFYQRNNPDESLLLKAQALSLVYSFHGEDVSDGKEAELATLGALIAKSAQEMFEAVATLQARGLAQKRGVWRAVLPHAIANRLAALALKTIPYPLIEKLLINTAQTRMLKSFSRRLGYLHSSNKAVEIVDKWLAPKGLLGDVGNLNDLGRAMFDNVAPVSPEAALSALERAFLVPSDDEVVQRCRNFVGILRSIAYDASLFDRAIVLLQKYAEQSSNGPDNNTRLDDFTSLFSLFLSGTHASIEQRIKVVERLLLDQSLSRQKLGTSALKAALEAWHFMAAGDFAFGSHSRDYGFRPETQDELRNWFKPVFLLSQSVGRLDTELGQEVRVAVAEKLRGQWIRTGLYDEIDQLCRAIAEKRFWPEGWISVRQIIQLDSNEFPPDVVARLQALDELLRPRDLVQRISGIVLTKRHGRVDFGDVANDDPASTVDSWNRAEEIARNLGQAVATDSLSFEAVLPDLVKGTGRLVSFGRGLAEGAIDHRAIWNKLVVQVRCTPASICNVQVLQGFLNSLNFTDSTLASEFLDISLVDDALAPSFPLLQSSVGIDETGVGRLMKSLGLKKAPVANYACLAWWCDTDRIAVKDLKAMILEIIAVPEGFAVGVGILQSLLHSDKQQSKPLDPQLAEVGREILRSMPFPNSRGDHFSWALKEIIETCLVGNEGASVARDVCTNLMLSIDSRETYFFYHEGILAALFHTQPTATLDGIFRGTGSELGRDVHHFSSWSYIGGNPLALIPEDALLAWCDVDPPSRYPAIASVVYWKTGEQNGEPMSWTPIALRLLDQAPNRIEVLRQFIKQFNPSSYSGSLAAIMESGLKLLEQLLSYPDPTVVEFAKEEREKLIAFIATKRRSEAELNIGRNERFE